jgi:hypothetical protein
MIVWPLRNDRPAVEIQLQLAGGQHVLRWLVADTGAGTRRDTFELILDEDDCLQCGGVYVHTVRLRGAYDGSFPVYVVDVRADSLNFSEPVNVVGVPSTPRGFDGIACFRFLRRFHYGNFGDPDVFGLDALKFPRK